MSDELTDINLALDRHAIVSIADVKGNIIYVNNKFCEISGYTEDDLLGANHRIVRSKRHSEQYYKKMWRTIANGDVWEGEICNLTKTQDEYWVKTTIVPVLDKTGKPIKYVSIRTDISEQKNLETKLTNLTIELNRRVAERTEKYKKAQADAEMSLHSIEALLSSVDQGIVEMDNDIRLVRWNSRYEELLEIPSGFLQVGKEGLDILRFLAYRGDYGPGNPEELARARFESLTRIDEVPRTVTFRKKLHVDVRVHRTPTGGWVESFTDVTEAKKSEIALSEARNAADFDRFCLWRNLRHTVQFMGAALPEFRARNENC